MPHEMAPARDGGTEGARGPGDAALPGRPVRLPKGRRRPAGAYWQSPSLFRWRRRDATALAARIRVSLAIPGPVEPWRGNPIILDMPIPCAAAT
jgi:hypothetical protein